MEYEENEIAEIRRQFGEAFWAECVAEAEAANAEIAWDIHQAHVQAAEGYLIEEENYTNDVYQPYWHPAYQEPTCPHVPSYSVDISIRYGSVQLNRSFMSS